MAKMLPTFRFGVLQNSRKISRNMKLKIENIYNVVENCLDAFEKVRLVTWNGDDALKKFDKTPRYRVTGW